MMRGWVVAAISLAACALTWAAEPSKVEKYGLEVTFPDKWIVGSGEEPLLMISRSMDQVSLANCVATGEQVAMTRGLTQEQINQGLAAPFGEDFWRQVYATSGLTADVKSQGARAHKSGVTIQEAYFDLYKTGGAPDAKMSVQQAIFVRPGLTVTMACSARAAVYSNSKAILSGIIDSVRFSVPAENMASAADPQVVPVKSGMPPQDPAALAAGTARAGVKLIELSK